MAELNLDYYTAKDHYSDGDIEETLLKMAQEGKSFEDLPEEEVSFPMVYHFSGSSGGGSKFSHGLSFFRTAGEYFKLVPSERDGFRS